METKGRNIILQSINIINRQLLLEGQLDDLTAFRHTINIGGSVDLTKKLVIARIEVMIHEGERENQLGVLKADFCYWVSDFEDLFVQKTAMETITKPKDVLNLLIQESIASMRGIMFESFRGTPLHNAYLPIVLPKNFIEQLKEPPVTKKGSRK
jgi:hypothetical protein